MRMAYCGRRRPVNRPLRGYSATVRVAITGASGLVGRAVSAALKERGDEPVAVLRTNEGQLRWSLDAFDPPNALSGFDAVVHLAGESVGGSRWSSARKERIRDSRVRGTRTVVQALRDADPRPSILVSASAVGYYGDNGDGILNDDAPPGDTFLADVVRSWEHEASAATELGVRVAMPRFGIILSPAGGALQQMLLPFRLGVGGRLGDGRQYFPWVHLADAVRGVLHGLDGHIEGPFNCMAPNPVTNREFTRELASVLRRPAIFPVPLFVLRMALGELADSVLESQRAVPQRLVASGFEFQFPRLPAGLIDLLTGPHGSLTP
jgi:uncharacterized protein (TIGR01777 family)